MAENQLGRVYLVGAGCGSADLITVRGMELLHRCQAVVYDDLIDRALLEAVPSDAERIYMGKRAGRHSAPQEQISTLLVRLAREKKLVVRLKGGDPYVFGRGGEEFQSLLRAGIPCEEVPGISSSIAIPAAAGIPVTFRHMSRSVHIITGHADSTDEALPPELDYLAQLPGTLVFLMGLAQLSRITCRLLEAGKAPSTPAAVVSGGNSAHPADVRATLATIAQAARVARVQPPAVIVIGDVAALDLRSTVFQPLLGVRVGLTGTSSIAARIAPPLREAGACVEWLHPHRLIPLPNALDGWALPTAGWLVFTSRNGVRTFFSQLDCLGVDRRQLSGIKFAVIGAATAQALLEYGYRADLCPAVFTSAMLAEALIQTVLPGEKVTLLRSAQADSQLAQLLEGAGLRVMDLRIYDVAPQSVELPSSPTPDYLVFSSAGGVRAYWSTFGTLSPRTCPVCIGAVTAKALCRIWDGPFLTATSISAEGLLEVISKDHSSRTLFSGK